MGGLDLPVLGRRKTPSEADAICQDGRQRRDDIGLLYVVVGFVVENGVGDAVGLWQQTDRLGFVSVGKEGRSTRRLPGTQTAKRRVSRGEQTNWPKLEYFLAAIKRRTSRILPHIILPRQIT